MKHFFIAQFTGIVFLYCTSNNIVVTFKECHDSICSNLNLYENGTFDLKWSLPSGFIDNWYTRPSKYYAGEYLNKENNILLYTDSVFDSKNQIEELFKLKSKERIKLINSSRNISEYDWKGDHFRPNWSKYIP